MRCRTGRLTISAVLALTSSPRWSSVSGPRAAAEAMKARSARTPPRLSYADGEVSYFRPGAQDWAPAEVNTALAPGDELYTGNRGNLELQVGGRAFVRAWGDSQLGLVNQSPTSFRSRSPPVTCRSTSARSRRAAPSSSTRLTRRFTIDRRATTAST